MMTETFTPSISRPSSYTSGRRARCRRAVAVQEHRGVALRHFLRPARHDYTPAFEEQGSIAKGFDDSRIVADDENGVAQGAELPIAILAARLEAGVADSEDLVEHEHLTD